MAPILNLKLKNGRIITTSARSVTAPQHAARMLPRRRLPGGAAAAEDAVLLGKAGAVPPFAPKCAVNSSFASSVSSSESEDSEVSTPSSPYSRRGYVAELRSPQPPQPQPDVLSLRQRHPVVPPARRPRLRGAPLADGDTARVTAKPRARRPTTGSARVVEFSAQAGGATGGVAQQRRAFCLIYSAYVGMLIARKNYGFWLPHAMEILALEKPDVAVVGSSFEIASGYGALLNGFLIDAFEPAYGLAAALAVSALVNLLLSGTRSLTLMAALWGVNGAAQSFGWPCVSRIFLRAFPDPRGRGMWYSILSTSQNVGAALVPLLVTSAVTLSGEPRAAFWLPAAVTACLSLLLFCALAPERRAVGPARKHAPAPAPAPAGPAALPAAAAAGGASAAPGAAAAGQPAAHGSCGWRLLLDVLRNWRLWSMAANYFSIGIIRSCLTDWSPIFLREDKGLSVLAASRCLCAFELGGFLGSVAAGRLSDLWCGGRRGPVIASCTALLCPALLGLAHLRAESSLCALYFALGGLAFPVHVLLGLASREVVSPAASSTAGGLVKFVAQMGASSAGYPLGLLQREHGWGAVLCLLSAVAAGGGALACSLWWTVARTETAPPPPRDEQQPHRRKGG